MKIWIQDNICQTLLVVFLIAHPQNSLSCSAFSASVANNTQSFALAANYDWNAKGGFISTQPTGIKKAAFLPHSNKCLASMNLDSEYPAVWVSKFASATLTQWGQEFPVQGINTQGLSGIVLNSTADYPSQPGLPSITELQWLQYQLDNFESVDEVTKHVSDLNIKKLSGSLHYYFCDAASSCILIEFLDGVAVTRSTTSNLGTQAITNSPYETSIDYLSNFDGVEFSKLPQDYLSLNRFVRATWWSKTSFNNLDNVFDGLINLSHPRFTRWMAVFSPMTAEFQMKIPASEQIFKINTDEFKGSCKDSVAKMKILSDSDIGEWQLIDKSKIQDLITHASYGIAGYNASVIKELVEYPDSLSCAF